MADQEARHEELKKQLEESVKRTKELRGLVRDCEGPSEQLLSDVAILEVWVAQLAEYPSSEEAEAEEEEDCSK